MKLLPRHNAVIAAVGFAALLAVPFSFGKAPDLPKVQAEVLDQVDLPCANCFFGPNYNYFCFAADNKILIGYQRTPVLNWRDTSKNYLTKVRHKWDLWSPPSQSVPISYDDKHIWVTRPDGKQVKLIQKYSTDIFLNNDRCRTAVRSKTH